MAAEQGVSQQAIHFKAEYDRHTDLAWWWGLAVAVAAGCLAIYAFLSMYLHKIIGAEGTYQIVQVAISKVLIFFVLAYLLVLAARNFLSHTHNAIVNKHRQNALATFQTLADAAGSADKRDIVLTYAAASIFTPQETGFSKSTSGTSPSPTQTLIEVFRRSGDTGSSTN